MPTPELRKYMEDIRAMPKLAAEDEPELLQRARLRDDGARRRVIEGYLVAVADAAVQRRPARMSEVDAVQEANVMWTALVDNPAVGNPRWTFDSTIEVHLRALGPA